MSERLRVAVVGLGTVARAIHLPIMTRRSDRFEIVGICDLSRGAVAAAGERFSVTPERRFTALDRMLGAVRADALAVLTSGSHTAAAIGALDRGLAVLCEKPLAMTQRDANLLATAVGDRTDRLMLAYMKLYDPAVRHAVDLVARRPRPRAIDVTVLHPSGAAQLVTSELGPGVFDDVPRNALADLHDLQRALEVEALGEVAAGALGSLYSGVLLGSVVHDLAVLRALGIEIAVIDHADRWPAGTVPGSLAFHGRTADDVRVTIAWHYLHDYPTYREQVRWHDEDGSVELDFPSPYVLRAPTGLREITAIRDGTSDHRFASHVEAFEEELLAFHAMVTESIPPAAGVLEGRADIVTCQRIAAVLARNEGIAIGGEAAAVSRRRVPRAR